MTRRLSLIISWGATALLIVIPCAALVLLVQLPWFAELAKQNLRLPIYWQTVTDTQLYALWGLTALYLSIGLFGLYFLRRAFGSFAKGDLFNAANSKDLKRFSMLLLAHAIATPVHIALTSVLLSLNHPPGEKMLSIAFGSNELRAIGVGLVLWVMSNLLVEGTKLKAENRQFV
ncbi:MAG: DUF2975 domain-containing protein [Pseudomonadota bacterium]